MANDTIERCPNCGSKNHGFRVARCVNPKCTGLNGRPFKGCFKGGFVFQSGCWKSQTCPFCDSSYEWIATIK